MADTVRVPGQRVASIDALRGFDMFWIIGGDHLVRAVCKRFNAPWAKTLAEQFTHVEWEGFRFYDLIFPLFLFLVGAVLPFSLEKYGNDREGRRHAMYRILVRAVVLFFFGLIVNGLLTLNFSDFRYAGVLQRIAVCYFAAAWIVVLLPRWSHPVLFAGLVAAYAALLTYVPVPNFGPGDFSKEGNLSIYFDQQFLPGRLYYGDGDNEGLLSHLGALATTLLGVCAGHWLRVDRPKWLTVVGLGFVGGMMVWGGVEWGKTLPIIKNIWTSSFVLVSGGWSLTLLAIFYGVIDGLGVRRWAFFFTVIGCNAITIYMAPRFIDFGYTSKALLGGLTTQIGYFADRIDLVQIASVLVLKWLFLLVLYRNKWFLRV